LNPAAWASALLVVTGGFFFLAGTVGLLRFPDTFSRLHAVTKADNLGLGLVAVGLAIQAGTPVEVLKLLVIWGLALFASATACQIIARAAFAQRAETQIDEQAVDA
jgi:multicomponent Na+:H+ antiporter subunit G